MGYGVSDTGVDFDFVTPAESHALLKSDSAIFVDSRDAAEYKISRIQTSYSFPANDIMFRPDKLDKTLVQRCKDLASNGKLVIVVSDAGITGMQNRGHVSRCRHVSQFLHELGVEREHIRRLQGGINSWKSQGLDGIFGDTRRYYAGTLVGTDSDISLITELSPQAAALTDDATTITAATQSAVMPHVHVTSPTAYRVIAGEVYKKASSTGDKIVKLDRSVDSIVRTTGQIFVGPSGGKWAELDAAAGEKKGWVYVEGPGFGPSTRHVTFEYLRP